MLIRRFTGIDNVNHHERVLPDVDGQAMALAQASNCDIGNDLEIMRRQGWTLTSDVCHKNLWQADGFMLATTAGGDLVAIADGDTPEDAVLLYESLGPARVWYCNLPDGRTTFSNGSINGITDGTAAGTTKWGVPAPAGAWDVAAATGDLFAGKYRVAITHVRTIDGLEGPPSYSAEVELEAGAGISLTNLPVLAGHTIVVYISSHNGGKFFRAGVTSGTTFSYSGGNDALVRECRTEYLSAAPVGTVTALWNGRTIVADGGVLWASRHAQWEHFNLSEDFKLFGGATITLVQPVDAGIFVGTTKGLAFLRGTQWSQLAYEEKVSGAVVLGSGVTVPGEHLARGEGSAGPGDCMVCIANGIIVAGYQDGSVAAMTEDRYRTGVAEVAATFRLRDPYGLRIPQYIAIEQA
jgi:hypothetical protein